MDLLELLKKNIKAEGGSDRFAKSIANSKRSTSVASAAQSSQATSNSSGISLETATKPKILAEMSPESIEQLSKAGMAIKTARSNAIISEAGLNIAKSQAKAQAAAQPAPSLWSRTKAATANMFGKSAKVAPEPAGGDTGIALGTATAHSVTPAATTPGFAARFNTILNQKINPTKQVQDTDNSSVDTTNESSEGLSYYERAKAAASNAARVTGNALVTGAKNAYHAPGALVGAAGGDANFMTTAGKAVYNAPGKVSVALGGQQKIITGETGSLRSLSGYDKYSKDAVQGGQTGWNFATKANQNYTKKTSDFMGDNLETTSNGMVRAKPATQVVSAEVSNPMYENANFDSNSATTSPVAVIPKPSRQMQQSDFMADNLETTSNGMVRAKPATNWLTAPNIETGQVTTPRPLKNPKPVKDTFLDSSNLGTAGGTLNPMRQNTSQNRPSNTAYTQGALRLAQNKVITLNKDAQQRFSAFDGLNNMEVSELAPIKAPTSGKNIAPESPRSTTDVMAIGA